MVRRQTVVAALALVFVLPCTAWPQSEATVRGQISAATDASLLGGAAITLTKSPAGAVLQQVADGEGRFVFLAVAPGEYLLGISAKGFASREIQFMIEPRETRTFDASLEIAAVAIAVEVAVDRTVSPGTHSPSSTTLTLERLGAMSIFQRITLADAIVSSAPGMIRGHDDFVHIRGHEVALNPLINGVSFWENTHSVFSAGLSPDVIETANIMTGGFPAEYGNRFGGVIDIVTRSGLRTPDRVACDGQRRRCGTLAWQRRSGRTPRGIRILRVRIRIRIGALPQSAGACRHSRRGSRRSRVHATRQRHGTRRIDPGGGDGRRHPHPHSEDRGRCGVAADGERTARHRHANRDRQLDGRMERRRGRRRRDISGGRGRGCSLPTAH